MYKIFDIHTHIYPDAIAKKAVASLEHFYSFRAAGKGTYNDLKKHAKKGRLSGFLLFSVATSPHQVTKINDCIARFVALARKDGFESAGFGAMHQDFEDVEEEIARIETLGLKGVKMHPDFQGIAIDHPKLFPLYSLIEGRLPLYLHMGDDRAQYQFSRPEMLAAVMDRFPRLEVVAAHLGGYRSWEAAERYLAGRDNLWFDTSSAIRVMTPEYARRSYRFFRR